jgi:hypothetical protein
MNTKQKLLSKISLGSRLAVAFAVAACTAGAAEHAKTPPGPPANHPASHPGPMGAAAPMSEAQHQTHMQHITTQAQAEALKPGDSMSMACSKCKDVMVQPVTTDNAHVKMMTVGEKTKCPGCDGTVEVVATGKGTGKNAEVKHVCSKCGDDAMFCSATTPGSGAMKDMGKMKGMGKGKMMK